MAIKLKKVLNFIFLIFLIFVLLVAWLSYSKNNNKTHKGSDPHPHLSAEQKACFKVAETAIAKNGKGYPESVTKDNNSLEFWVGSYRFDFSGEPKYFVTYTDRGNYIGSHGRRVPDPGQDVLTRIPFALLVNRYPDQFHSLPNKGTYLQIGIRCALGEKIKQKWAEQLSPIEKEQEQDSKFRVPSLKEIGIDNGLRIFISGMNEPYAQNTKYYYPLNHERQYDGRLLSFQCNHNDICHGNFYLADDLKITFAFPHENLSDWQAIYSFVLDYTKRNMSF